MRRTTAIRVHGQTWHVPRGFGRVYRDLVRSEDEDLAMPRGPGRVIDVVIDMLALVGYAATRAQVADWLRRQRIEAIAYAATEHARAGDNSVQRHPRPSWLPEDPWKGPPRGEGVFAGPSGTPIPVRRSRRVPRCP